VTHPTVYPEPRYRGGTGEVSATLRRADHKPELSHASGGGAHYLATGASTDGEFGLYRWDMGETPSGPEAHFHASISESFFVLSGTVRLYDGGSWIEGLPGDFLYVPPGGIHAFRNESASMLILFTPGAPREDYFETLATGRLKDMTDDERVAFFLRHDTFWT
jgi:mannose-6-phosphate isomerase-like protein (cupin superfamily)